MIRTNLDSTLILLAMYERDARDWMHENPVLDGVVRVVFVGSHAEHALRGLRITAACVTDLVWESRVFPEIAQMVERQMTMMRHPSNMMRSDEWWTADLQPYLETVKTDVHLLAQRFVLDRVIETSAGV